MPSALCTLFSIMITLGGGRCYPNLQMRKLSHKEVKELIQGPMANGWWSWDSLLGLMESQAPLYDSLRSVFVWEHDFCTLNLKKKKIYVRTKVWKPRFKGAQYFLQCRFTSLGKWDGISFSSPLQFFRWLSKGGTVWHLLGLQSLPGSC